MGDLSRLSNRRSYQAVKVYAGDTGPCPLDLTDNTNLWGAPPAAVQLLQGAVTTSVSRYPQAYSASLKVALADYAGVRPEHIVTGCGSGDVLDGAIRAFTEAGDRVAIPDPTFVMIPVFARLSSLEPVLVPLTADYDVNVEAMLAADPKVIYLCSPNNPTGVALRRSSIEALLERADPRALVIVDEAYAEFAGTTAVDFLEDSNRLLVVRTMSKAFGLAGLRIGYGIGAPEVVGEVEKSRGPFKVAAVAEQAAVAALTTDLPWVRAQVAQAVATRDRVVSALSDLGLAALPSSTNFILVPIRQCVSVAAALREHGVAVRPFAGLAAAPGTTLAETGGDALRITIGPWPLMEQLLSGLRAVL